MAWVLLDDNFPLHPKAVQAGPLAAYLYVCGLCYCRKHHTGGFIPRKALPMLGVTSNPRRMVDALVQVGLWDLADDGWQVHDYNGFYADEIDKAEKDEQQQERAELRRIRQEAGRKGGKAKREATSKQPAKQNARFASSLYRSGEECSSDQLLEEKKRDADFGNFWAAYPRKDAKQKAQEAWMKLAPTDEQQRQIAADLERRGRSSQWLKEGGQFIPMPATYLNQRRWEDGFEERPRLAERTINVIKGFDIPDKEIA